LDSFSGKELNSAARKGYDTIFSGVNRKVAAEFGAFAGALGQADLAHDNLASLDLLATE
jgi:hypothetical protein